MLLLEMLEEREAVLYNAYVTSDVLKFLLITLGCVDIICGLTKANFSNWVVKTNSTKLIPEDQDGGR